MGWTDVTEQSGAGGSGATFLKFKAGQSHKIHIIDEEPYSYKSAFFRAIEKSAVIDPNDNPLDGMKGFDVKTRHAINVYDYDDATIKVMAGSNAMFSAIKAIHDEWGGFDQVDLKITRQGEGLDTKYQIVPTAKCQWDPSLIEGQELFDLATVFAITPREVVESYAQGIDKSADFNPAELNGDEPITEAPVEDESVIAPKAKAPLPKPAIPAAAPNVRSALVTKLMAAIKAKVRYKKDGQWLADIKKFGGANKSSVSQLDVESLQKLFKFVQTVK